MEESKVTMDSIEADLKKIVEAHRSGTEVSAEIIEEINPMVRGFLTPTKVAFFAESEKQRKELRKSLGLPEETPVTPLLEAPHNTPTTHLILPRETDMGAVEASLVKWELARQAASLESVLTACEPEDEDIRTAVATHE